MSFKFTPLTFVAALAAFVTAGGAAYTAAYTNATPGVQAGEWGGIITAGLVAAAGVFFHDTSQAASGK